MTWIVLVALVMSFAARAETRGLTREQSQRVFGQNENYAVVVGIDRYDEMPDLNHAVDDARRMKASFEAQGYTVFMLVDYEASPKRILRKVRDAGRLATDEGRSRRGSVVFAFSGHGFGEGATNYLATTETDPTRLDDGESLSLATVSEVLEASGVRQRVLFVDACRNVPGTKGVGSLGEGFAADETAEGTAVLYSTGPRRLSWEDPRLGHGVFTHFLAEGLEGAAAGPDGLVTFERLRNYVSGQVKRYVMEAFGEVQVPYIAGERTGEFVLARVGPGETPAASLDETPARGTGRLTVDVAPIDATVRIMNIESAYRPGLELSLGESYDVLVTRDGYEPYLRQVTLDRSISLVSVRLEPEPGSSEALKVAALERAMPPKPNVVARALHVSCSLGHVNQCMELANLYDRGERVEKSQVHAATLFERACDRDHSGACAALGSMYGEGVGREPDPRRAAELRERACDLGERSACPERR